MYVYAYLRDFERDELFDFKKSHGMDLGILHLRSSAILKIMLGGYPNIRGAVPCLGGSL